ncbi:MAG: hypothetical protein JWR77_110 [Rhizorhabdus sp.]|nr:hypothetical protein [Rhizorhabdus sp.]
MLNILVVEDNPVIAGQLAELLESLGHAPLWTGVPDRLSPDPSTDLVLLDLGLGDRDGFELLEQLAAADARPPLAIASGHDRRIIDAACRLAEARGLLVVGTLRKPYSRAAVSALLDQVFAVDRSEATRADPASPPPGPAYLFQSKHDLGSGAVTGYEALLRLPGIDDIEAYFAGLDPMRALELTVTAAEAAARLHQHFAAAGRPLTMAFNCPPDIFAEPAFLGLLKDVAARFGIEPSALAIELTEQAGHIPVVEIASMAGRYTLAGFQVHLDDFGSGTSSLEQFLRLPLREVKIDRRVFRSLLKEGEALLFEIIAHCGKHGILSTIEGIETEQEWLVASQSGANFGQGYFWSRPQPMDTIIGQLMVAA